MCVYTGLRQDDYQKPHFGQDSNSAKVTDIVTEAHNSYMASRHAHLMYNMCDIKGEHVNILK